MQEQLGFQSLSKLINLVESTSLLKSLKYHFIYQHIQSGAILNFLILLVFNIGQGQANITNIGSLLIFCFLIVLMNMFKQHDGCLQVLYIINYCGTVFYVYHIGTKFINGRYLFILGLYVGGCFIQALEKLNIQMQKLLVFCFTIILLYNSNFKIILTNLMLFSLSILKMKISKINKSIGNDKIQQYNNIGLENIDLFSIQPIPCIIIKWSNKHEFIVLKLNKCLENELQKSSISPEHFMTEQTLLEQSEKTLLEELSKMFNDNKNLCTQEKIIQTQYDKFNKKYEVTAYLQNSNFILFVKDITDTFRANQLEEINQYKDALLANVSHDLRVPINGINGMLQTAKSCDNIKLIKTYVNDAQNCVQIGLNLINDILDSAQIQKGQLRLNKSEFSIKDFLTNLYKLFETQAKAKGIKLLYHIDSNTPTTILTDPDRLRQILINLISNALKFTNEGFIHTQVSVPKISNNQSLIQFSVKDTGLGIKKDDQYKLFQRFETLQTKQNTNKHGIGIGLTIAKMLVGQLGPQEDIQIQSQFEKGSVFSFIVENPCTNQIPENCSEESEHSEFFNELLSDDSDYLREYSFSTDQNDSPEQHILSTLNQKVPSQRQIKRINSRILKNVNKSQLTQYNKQKTVLIVDDDAYTSLVIKNFLNKIKDITIEKAFNGEQAFQKIQEKSKTNKQIYDIIFMDGNMPIMDGYTSTIKIKQLLQCYKLQDIPIIGLTGNCDEESRQKCLKSGMSDVLTKPCSQEALLKLLEEYIYISSEKM